MRIYYPLHLPGVLDALIPTFYEIFFILNLVDTFHSYSNSYVKIYPFVNHIAKNGES